MTTFSRRDFLKVAGVTLAGALTSEQALSLKAVNDRRPNVIVILMDALSARHLSLYGYPRLTTPNLDAFAERSTVFHNHYSGGNFTTTGVASMLTGMIAWKHRAINQGGLVRSGLVQHNPYTLLGSDYYRFAFCQNIWADRLIGQYSGDVDRFLSPASYSLSKDGLSMETFNKDRALASVATDDFLFPAQANIPGSLLAGYINKSQTLGVSEKQKNAYSRYPSGIPEALIDGYIAPYLNETIYAGVYSELSQLDSMTSPYFAYFHLFSPHFPYKPRRDYLKLFRDKYYPTPKPAHALSFHFSEDYLSSKRTVYDRQIAQLDDEFGALISRLNQDGILENSYLIFTADHGELFERGFAGHGFQFMYEAVLQIPLIIHAPRQTKREDVFSLTSNIDVLPTILSIAGKNLPSDLDGKVLPGLGGQADENRPIFSMIAEDNSAFAPIKKAIIAMRKRAYKLIAYLNYAVAEPFELYNLESDPEELNNLAEKDAPMLSAMKDELFTHLNAANKMFAKT